MEELILLPGIIRYFFFLNAASFFQKTIRGNIARLIWGFISAYFDKRRDCRTKNLYAYPKATNQPPFV